MWFAIQTLSCVVIVPLDVLTVWTSGQSVLGEYSGTGLCFPLCWIDAALLPGGLCFGEGTSRSCVFTPAQLTVSFLGDHAGLTAWTEEVQNKDAPVWYPPIPSQPCGRLAATLP